MAGGEAQRIAAHKCAAATRHGRCSQDLSDIARKLSLRRCGRHVASRLFSGVGWTVRVYGVRTKVYGGLWGGCACVPLWVGAVDGCSAFGDAVKRRCGLRLRSTAKCDQAHG